MHASRQVHAAPDYPFIYTLIRPRETIKRPMQLADQLALFVSLLTRCWRYVAVRTCSRNRHRVFHRVFGGLPNNPVRFGSAVAISHCITYGGKIAPEDARILNPGAMETRVEFRFTSGKF